LTTEADCSTDSRTKPAMESDTKENIPYYETSGPQRMKKPSGNAKHSSDSSCSLSQRRISKTRKISFGLNLLMPDTYGSLDSAKTWADSEEHHNEQLSRVDSVGSESAISIKKAASGDSLQTLHKTASGASIQSGASTPGTEGPAIQKLYFLSSSPVSDIPVTPIEFRAAPAFEEASLYRGTTGSNIKHSTEVIAQNPEKVKPLSEPSDS